MSISPHAEPFYADAAPTGSDGQRIGVLLSHGFTGCPASMVPWGRHLAGLGYAVAVPRLPGHGTSWQELNKCRWADWYGEAGGMHRRAEVGRGRAGRGCRRHRAGGAEGGRWKGRGPANTQA